VADVVKRQLDLGLDIINEGEYGHITSGAVDYGAWWNYSFSRLGGLTMTDTDRWESAEVVRSKPGEPRLTSFIDRRDRALFSEAYNDPDSGIFTGRAKVANPEFTGPVTYIGQDEVAADVRLLADALPTGTPGFIAALSPGSAARLTNRYYNDEHELLADVGRAMRTEYQAITDAGLTVQCDAPDLAEAWDQINPEPSVEDFRGFIRERIDVLTIPSPACPRNKRACISAGAPGTARTLPTCPLRISSRKSCAPRSADSPSRPLRRATRMSGACGRTTRCRRAL